MEQKTIYAIQKEYEAKIASPTSLVAYYLERIGERDGSLHAFLNVFHEDAEAQARQSEERIVKKQARPLEGIPVAVKDNMMLHGTVTTAGSKILESYRAVYTATAVKRLQDAGAIILGKTNLDEFAMGSSTEFSGFGPTKNPHDESRVPGGSSGGSAAAVAAGFCPAAIGSDTGGSIRQPASFCGVVGFKPSYGRISRYGLIAMASSLDQIGSLTTSVEDARLLYRVMKGRDEHDATTREEPDENRKEKSLKGMRFALPESFFKHDLDVDVTRVFESAVKKMTDAGAIIETVSMPHVNLSLPVYYLIVTSEVSSNLARYDGIRYGQPAQADGLIQQYIATRTAGFGEEAKRRVMLGTFTLSAGYRDKYYGAAVKLRALIASELDKVLSTYDAIVSPTTPTKAFLLGEKYDNPLTMYLSDLFTVPANIANVPAISLPVKTDTLPIGLQLMGRRFGDEEILDIAETVSSIVS